MNQRRFSPIICAIALPVFLGVSLSSCTSPESDSNSDSSLPPASETVEEKVGETAASSAPAAISNVEAASDAASSDSSSSAEPTSTTNQVAGSSPSPPASNDAPSTEPKAAAAKAKDPQKTETAEDIRIDETVCGAGGQEAYFETKIQEIYICKNEAEALTYIATPKKKGNSLFLPAQKIQQGDIVGYAAIDETKTYIVTPGGFQLQDNGKSTKSEKVIRRQLSKD